MQCSANVTRPSEYVCAPTPQPVARTETTLKYSHDNYSDYNYDMYNDYNYNLYLFTPLTPLGTQPPPSRLG